MLPGFLMQLLSPSQAGPWLSAFLQRTSAPLLMYPREPVPPRGWRREIITNKGVLDNSGTQPHPEIQTQLSELIKGFCKGFSVIPSQIFSRAGSLYVAWDSVTLNSHQPHAGPAEMCVGTHTRGMLSAAWINRAPWEAREAGTKAGLGFPSQSSSAAEKLP